MIEEESKRKMITCTGVGASYRNALTRGKQYELIRENDEKVKVLGDNGRTRWYSSIHFDMEGNPAPILMRWKFDERLEVGLESWIDLTMQFSDGSYRWLIIVTPKALQAMLEDSDMEPGIWASHMTVVRSLTVRDVSMILAQLDSEGNLFQASRPIESYDESYEANHEWFAALKLK